MFNWAERLKEILIDAKKRNRCSSCKPIKGIILSLDDVRKIIALIKEVESGKVESGIEKTEEQ